MIMTVDDNEIRLRRRKAVKTAVALGAIAVLIFVTFILSGVLGVRA